MKRAVWIQVVKAIERLDFEFRSCVKKLVELFPDETEPVLRSVAAQQYQKRVKKASGSLKNKAKRSELYKEYLVRAQDARKSRKREDSSVICEMAKEIRFSPFLLGKLILEEYLANLPLEVKGLDFPSVSDMTRSPYKIPDRDLAVEIDYCKMRDDQYGHYSEAIKHCTGEDYETKIKDLCKKFGLSFRDEKALRTQGYDKTPDVLLDIPIAVRGCAVNWIESKALFGDEEAHRGYLANQVSFLKQLEKQPDF